MLPFVIYWPVLLRLGTSVLAELRQHDDEVHLVLPHHAPERRHGFFQRSLGGNVRVAPFEPVAKSVKR